MHNLYTQVFGEGPDVVLLHGWGMHSGIWEDVVEGLIDQYRITVLDLPGHGYSRSLTIGPTLEDWAMAVQTVTPDSARWIGWSLGGLVAQFVALTVPERVQQLVLVNSTPCFVQRPDWPHGQPLPVLHRFAEELRQDYRTVLNRFIALEVHGSAHAAAQLRELKDLLFQHGEPEPAGLAAGLAILEATDLRPRWSQLCCPVLLLMGQRDQLVPPSAGTALVPCLPKGQLRILPKAGHAPFLSHLSEFLAELNAFFQASP